MRRHALLTVLGVLGAEANHPVHQVYTIPGMKTLHPMVALYDCRNASSSRADCGPAVPLRDDFEDLCVSQQRLEAGRGRMSLSLQGQVIDIVVMPDEDETLILSDEHGHVYLGGMVGELLNHLAQSGGFMYRAIVVMPPDEEYENWTSWMQDWVNRADLVACWFYDTRDRRDKGITYPYNFYHLSPHLVVRRQETSNTREIIETWFRFLKPFTWDLWLAICAMVCVSALALGFVEESLFVSDEQRETES